MKPEFHEMQTKQMFVAFTDDYEFEIFFHLLYLFTYRSVLYNYPREKSTFIVSMNHSWVTDIQPGSWEFSSCLCAFDILTDAFLEFSLRIAIDWALGVKVEDESEIVDAVKDFVFELFIPKRGFFLL